MDDNQDAEAIGDDTAILLHQLTLRHYMTAEGSEWVTASSHDATVSVVTMLGILELAKAIIVGAGDDDGDDEY